MFKKIMPVLALVAVVVFSSFSLANKVQHNALASTVYTFDESGVPSPGSEEDFESCTGTIQLCAIEFTFSATFADAQNAQSELGANPTVGNHVISIPGHSDITVTVYLRGDTK